MKALFRYLFAILSFIGGCALLWGGASSNVDIESYLLFIAGAVFIIDAIGLAMNTAWVKSTWTITLIGTIAFALYYAGEPFIYPNHKGLTAHTVIFIGLHMIPMIVVALFVYFLPRLLDNQR